MKVNVTTEDIRHGGHYCDNCPIHHALARVGLHEVKVHRFGLKFGLDGMAFSSPDYMWEEMGLKHVGEWVRRYDESNHIGQLEPFSFSIAAELFTPNL